MAQNREEEELEMYEENGWTIVELVSQDSSHTDKKKYTQIVITGGWDGKYRCDDIFILDYNEKTWKRVSIKLPLKLADFGSVALNDELYIMGGRAEAADFFCCALYRLNKQMKWEKMADLMEKKAHISNSCLSHNGSIWVIGGISEKWTPLNTVEKYDPAKDRWEKKPAMHKPRGFTTAAVIVNKIYVCGGSPGPLMQNPSLDFVEVFDIDSEIWTDFCTLPEPRSSMSVIVDGTNIVLIGGFSNGKAVNAVWKMDVERESENWMCLSPLKEGRFNFSAVRIERETLIFGGINASNTVISTVEIFDGHRWEGFTPLPEMRCTHPSVILTPAMIDAFRPYIE